MKKLVTILLIVCSFSLNAQQYFTKTFDIGYYENTDKMMIDDNGNILLCGWYRSEGGSETGYILKLDADGEILWENQDYFVNDIIQISDGNYCFSDWEMAVRKINQHTGELIWSFVGEEQYPPLWLKYNNIIENYDGNIFIGVVGDLTPRILILSSEGELLEYNAFNYPLWGKTLKTIQVDDDEYITLNHCYRQDYPNPDHSQFSTHQKDGTISIASIFIGSNLPMFTKDGDYLYTFSKLGLEHGRRFVVYKIAYPFTINITYNIFSFNNYTSKLVDITNYNHNFMISGNVGNHIFIIAIDKNLDEIFLKEYNLNFKQEVCNIASTPEGDVYIFGRTFYDESLNSDIYLIKTNFDSLVGEDEIKISGLVKVFPNPASESLTIITEKHGEVTVDIYSMNGQKLKSTDLKNQTLNISDLPKGNYLFRISADGKVISTESIIKF